jgi:hypothetical protein
VVEEPRREKGGGMKRQDYAQSWAEMRNLRAEKFLRHAGTCLLGMLLVTVVCGFIGSL